jgi:hypothetical protein
MMEMYRARGTYSTHFITACNSISGGQFKKSCVPAEQAAARMQVLNSEFIYMGRE